MKLEAVEVLGGFDCWYDAKTSQNHKRRRLNSDGNSKNFECDKTGIDIKGDDDYLTFLKLIRCEYNEGIDADAKEDDVDPEHKIFLENTKEDGKSYIYKVKKEDGTTVFVKYDEEDFSSVDVKKEGINISKVKKNLKSEPFNHGFGDPFLSDCEQTESPVDESYYMLLSQLRVNGHSLILEWEDGVVKYEECNEMDYEEFNEMNFEEFNEISSYSEGLATEGNRYCSEQKFTPFANPELYYSSTDEDDVQSVSCVNASSEYEEKLKKSLRIPFNRKEFEELLDAAKTHKPLERSRDLRGRSVSYPTDQTRSYLGYHPDLAAMIEEAISQHNRYRALSLLRCLFFYLKNLSHQGAFVPWKNTSILEMIEARNYW